MVLDAVFYRLRNAGTWRDLPEGFGPWRTIYGRHRLWAREGLWARLLDRIARKAINPAQRKNIKLHTELSLS